MTSVPGFIAADPRYKSLSDQREDVARDARRAQAAYKRFTRGFLVAGAVAAVAGGLVLYGIDGSPGAASGDKSFAFLTSGPAQAVLRSVQALAVAAAAFCALVLNNQDYPQRWRQKRQRAEELRHERAIAALETGHRQGPDAFKEAGNYVYDDLVEGQITYLSGAIKVHETSSFRFTVLSGLIMAIGIGAPVLAQAGVRLFLLIGSLAAILTPALLAGLKSWSEATASGERSRLHEATRDLLYEVAGKRADLDAALDANDLDAAKEYARLAISALRADVDGFMDIMQGSFKPPQPGLPKQG